MPKILLFTAVLFFPFETYPQQNVALLGSLNPYPGKKYTDCWGYTDENGREYALMGVEDGTTIIDITDPSQPVEAAFIPGPIGPPYYWRDIKTHSHYAYVVSDNSGDSTGLQIIDLSGLPDTAILVNTLQTYFTTSHNLYIDNGYAYVVGTSNGGGIHILDLSDSVNPVETAYYDSSEYVHDVYVWNDTAYASSRDTYDLIDLTDKSNPLLISKSAELPGIYAHSGWLTEDKRYFIACEEFNVRDIIVWDLQDRSSWNLAVPQWQMPSSSRVHNIFIKGDYAHISYYAEGYVVLDISDPMAPDLVGHYDTYPGNSSSFVGAWGCYPFFNSGSVIVSDVSTGLYVFDFLLDNTVGNIDPDQSGISLLDFELVQNYPNPFNPSTKIKFKIAEAGFVSLTIYNSLGEEVSTIVNEYKPGGIYEAEFNSAAAGNELPSGLYIAKLCAGNFIQTIKMSLIK